MKKFIFTLTVFLLASQTAHAADISCDARATEKKLAGAAKNSFTKKYVTGASK
jgi:hypothetical protein